MRGDGTPRLGSNVDMLLMRPSRKIPEIRTPDLDIASPVADAPQPAPAGQHTRVSFTVRRPKKRLVQAGK